MKSKNEVKLLDLKNSIERSLSSVSPGSALTDDHLRKWAATMPAAAYVRGLNSDTARNSTAAVVALAASLLAPEAIPESLGSGRRGNAAQRFLAACQLPWSALRGDRLAELKAELRRRKYSVNTINQTLSAVRGVLTQCWRSGQLDTDSLERLKESLKSVRGSTLPRGRHVPREELQLILRDCLQDPTPAGIRDAVIVCLLAAGLRRAEVAGLQLESLDLRTGRLTVIGKGNKQRETYLLGAGLDAAYRWIELRGHRPGALLCGVNKHGSISQKLGMTSQAIYNALLKRAHRVGVEVSPHDLRRTLIGEAFSNGFDVASIQALVGHASPATTSRYDRRPNDVRKAMMSKLALEAMEGGLLQ